MSRKPGEGRPPVTIDGRPAGRDEAIGRAAAILRGSKAPVIWGLSGTTVEAVASALAIADRIGAVVDLAGSAEAAAKLRAFQRVGQVSASLGEVKDRADVVVFWGDDPPVTHPRHWERYSVEHRGRFVPGGRADRTVIVVDSELTETSRSADLFVRVARDRQAEMLTVLRSLVRGVEIDPGRAERATGVPLSELEALADRLKKARYGALFSGSSFGRGSAGAGAYEALLKLVSDLNEGRRFVTLGLGGPGDGAGASAVLGWQAGASSAVDYGEGYPRHLPGEATLAARLEAGEVDAVLIVADDPAAHLDAGMIDRLGTVPAIVVAPGATGWPRPLADAFDVARPGIEAGGTVARVDGVMLPLRPAISSGLPTDRDILDAIGASV